MKSFFAFFILFSLFTFANVINGRKDIGEYWRAVMKDQPMPEAIQGLISVDPITLPSVSNEKADCLTTESHKKKNKFVKDLGPEPTATAYDNGMKPKKHKSFSEAFDPSPNVFVYNDVVVKGEKSSAEDFEPSPNVSVYHDDATLKREKSFDEDFQPRPNVSIYDNGVGLKEKKSLSNDFEPRPSITAYSN